MPVQAARKWFEPSRTAFLEGGATVQDRSEVFPHGFGGVGRTVQIKLCLQREPTRNKPIQLPFLRGNARFQALNLGGVAVCLCLGNFGFH